MNSKISALESLLFDAIHEDFLTNMGGVPERHEAVREFKHNAEAGKFNPINFAQEDPDNLYPGREPLTNAEFYARKMALLHEADKKVDLGREAQVMAVLMHGMLQRYVAAQDGLDFVKTGLSMFAGMAGLSNEQQYDIWQAFMDLQFVIRKHIDKAGPAPEIDEERIREERALADAELALYRKNPDSFKQGYYLDLRMLSPEQRADILSRLQNNQADA